MDLLDHGHLDPEFLVLPPGVGLIADGQQHAFQPGAIISRPQESTESAPRGIERDCLLHPDQIAHLHFALKTPPLIDGLECQGIVVKLQFLDPSLQQIAHVAQLAIVVGGNAANVLDAMLSVDDHDAIMLAKGGQLVGAVQLSGQGHHLKLIQSSSEDLAPAEKAHALDEIRLDAHSCQNPALVPPDREGLLHDWRRLGRRLPALTHPPHLRDPPAPLLERVHHFWLVVGGNLPRHKGPVIDGQDGMRTGLGHDDRSLGRERAVHQHIGPAQIG